MEFDMSGIKTDLKDITFNLFQLIKIQENSKEFNEDELKDVLREFDKFAENKIFPTREKGNHPGAVLTDGEVCLPEEMVTLNKEFHENGWYGLGLPEDIGGFPAPNALEVACSSIAQGAHVGWSMYYHLSRGVMNCIRFICNEEDKNLLVPKLMSGEWGGTMCLTEAGAGSDVGAVNTAVTKRENGNYNLKRNKNFYFRWR